MWKFFQYRLSSSITKRSAASLTIYAQILANIYLRNIPAVNSQRLYEYLLSHCSSKWTLNGDFYLDLKKFQRSDFRGRELKNLIFSSSSTLIQKGQI